MWCLRQILSIRFLLVALLFCSASVAAQTRNMTPFAQADTSSPRAVLATFLAGIEHNLSNDQKAFTSYIESDRLYSNDEEERLWAENELSFLRGLETMDLSGLPSGFIDALAVEKIILLVDVLSRVEIPPLSEVPTHDMMKALGETSWRIPNTRIEIALVTDGPRQGEYLFSARTIVRLEEFYAALNSTPYKLERTKQYVEAYKPFASVDSFYSIYSNSIEGLGILPVRWLFKIPPWLNTKILGVTAWKHLGILLFLLISVLLIRGTWAIGKKSAISHQWRLFRVGLLASILAWLVIPLCAVYHISGEVLYLLGNTSVVILYFVGAWTAFVGTNALAETVIHLQSMRDGSIDSQLIRLGARLVGLVIATMLLIEGAAELGLPSYSVAVGIGVSGLAVAFASKETLSNLLGSFVILMEKPFRSGHWIKVGDAEGVVEYIGFRSTRIRTSGDSVLSIPNGKLVDSIVDNLGLRNKRQQRFGVHISYDTSRAKVDSFLNGVRQIISDHPRTDNEVSHVYVNEFGENGLNVLLYFYLLEDTYGSELREREGILLQILKLAEDLDVTLFAPHQSDGATHEKDADVKDTRAFQSLTS